MSRPRSIRYVFEFRPSRELIAAWAGKELSLARLGAMGVDAAAATALLELAGEVAPKVATGAVPSHRVLLAEIELRVARGDSVEAVVEWLGRS